MSADNWTTCHGCDLAAQQEVEKQRSIIADKYGTVKYAEYERVRSEAEKNIEWILRQSRGETFREDYEIHGADEGTVHVSYSGKCTECGYGISFETEHPIGGKEREAHSNAGVPRKR